VTETEERSGWYASGSAPFQRVANLSDGIFAIALTLLVLAIEIPNVAPGQLAGAMQDQVPQVIAFVISFALVAHYWWIHHRFFARLTAVEPGLIALNLLLLGCVALVPYPSGLLGQDPTARAAVLLYLAVIGALSIVHVLLLVRAHVTDVLDPAIPHGGFRYAVTAWGSGIVTVAVGMVLAWWIPVLGLVALLLTWPLEALVTRLSPTHLRGTF